METSILNSTKKILGVDKGYTAFDADIITHINSAFAILSQLGVGPAGGFFIEDASDEWDDYIVNDNGYNLIKTYIFLKVRILFDPPTTSFLLTAMEKQIQEYEWRISNYREWLLDPNDPKLVAEEVSHHGHHGW
jgi:hypothetical protein